MVNIFNAQGLKAFGAGEIEDVEKIIEQNPDLNKAVIEYSAEFHELEELMEVENIVYVLYAATPMPKSTNALAKIKMPEGTSPEEQAQHIFNEFGMSYTPDTNRSLMPPGKALEATLDIAA